MANSKIKGITIKLGGDTTELDKALSNSEKKAKGLQTELKGVNTLLKLDPSNVELLTQKQKLLTDAISSTEDKLKTLKTAQAQVQAQFEKGDITEEQFRSFQREIIATEQRLKKLKDEAKDFGSVFEQRMKVAGEKVKELGGKVENAGKKISGLSALTGTGLVASAKIASDNEAAINKYIASTGKATSETENYKNLMETIYQNNYGESIADVADKMRIVSNIMGNLPEKELQSIVEKSYMLEDAYDMDFQENIRGVNSLMKQFGISSEQAYELINQGAQKGLNQNQDLTDQIAEYSTYYAKLGFTAEDFFNIMIAGAEDGAYQIDYLNDAMKEFGIRTKDNSKSTNEAYEALGLDVDKINNKFAQGGDKAQEAFAEVTKAIMNIEDPVKRNEIGVALFGTKFEDLEESAVFAMTSAKDQVDMLGNTVKKTSETMYGGTSAKAQEATRAIQIAFASLGDSLLPIIAPIAEKIAELANKFSQLSPIIQNIILVVLGLITAFGPLLIFIGKIISAVGTIMPVLGAIGTFLTGTLIPAITAVVTALGWPVIAVMAIIGIIALLWAKCEWFRDLIYAWIDGFKLMIDGIVSFFKNNWQGLLLLIVNPFAGAFKLLYDNFEGFRKIVDEFVVNVKNIFSKIVDFFKNNWQGLLLLLVNPFAGAFKLLYDNCDGFRDFIDKWIKKIKDFFVNGFNTIKEKVVSTFTNLKNSVVNIANNLKDGVSSRFNSIKDTATSVFNKVKTAITSPIEKARDIVKGVVDNIKGFFNFKVSLPKIKLPHFSISPKGWQVGDLLKGKIPKLGIEWYAKGAILKKPTLFGINGNNAMVGGEAGAEAIAPISELLKYIKIGVDESLRGLLFDALTNFTNTKVQTRNTTIYGINELTHLLNIYMPEIIDNMGRDVILDGKKVGQTIAPEINKQLGYIATANARGR